MSTKNTTNLKRVTNTKLGRIGVRVFVVAWLLIAYISASQAIDTGSWFMYLLTVIALVQVIRFVKLSIKTHDNN